MKVEDIAARYPEVMALYLFGSRARGRERPDSDVDLAVLFKPGSDWWETRLDLSADLSARFGKPVDLVVLGEDLDLSFRILKEGRRLYERQRDAVRSREAVVASMYYDFAPFLHNYLDSVAKEFRTGG